MKASHGRCHHIKRHYYMFWLTLHVRFCFVLAVVVFTWFVNNFSRLLLRSVSLLLTLCIFLYFHLLLHSARIIQFHCFTQNIYWFHLMINVEFGNNSDMPHYHYHGMWTGFIFSSFFPLWISHHPQHLHAELCRTPQWFVFIQQPLRYIGLLFFCSIYVPSCNLLCIDCS